MDTQKIIEATQNVFIGADEREWDVCLQAFSENVYFDYSSMNGVMPAVTSAKSIIQNWKDFLPKFKATHHQLGNFTIRPTGKGVTVSFYGTATHFLPNESQQNVWTVVGTYRASLERHEESWKVTSLIFNLKYVDGNLQLPELINKG